MKRFFLILSLIATANFSFAQSVQTDTFQIGAPGSSANKEIKFGAGRGTKPAIRYNQTTSKFEFSNDASIYKALGSGSGSAAGINLLQNPGFEDGISSNWSNSGGTYAAVTSGSNLLFESISAAFTPSAAAQYFESAAVVVPNILYGAACMVKITYQGADANVYLTVLDGSSVELIPSSARATLNNSSGVKDAKVYFTCPSSGSIKLRVQSTAAGAIGYYDQAQKGQADFSISKQSVALGGIRSAGTAGCSWSTTSTTFVNHSANASCPTPSATGQVQAPPTKVPGVRIPNAAKGTYYFVATGRIQKGGSVDGAAYYRFSDGTNFSGSTGMRNNTSFSGGGVVAGSVVLPNDTTNWDVQIQGAVDGAVGTSTLIESVAGTPLTDFTIDVYYYPSGTDTIVNSKCLNDIACENYFTAKVDTSGNVTEENLDFISGSCTNANPRVCTFNTGIFTTTPNCFAQATTASGSPRSTTIQAQSSTSVSVRTYADGATNFQDQFTLICAKQGADFKAKQIVQGFFSNMLTSTNNLERVERVSVGPSVCTSTPCNISRQSGGISSVARTTTGEYTVNFPAGTFVNPPTCTCSATNLSGNARWCGSRVNINSATQAFFVVIDSATAAADAIFDVICVGTR